MLLANLFIQFFFYNQVYKEWTALQALAINKRLCKIQKNKTSDILSILSNTSAKNIIQ